MNKHIPLKGFTSGLTALQKTVRSNISKPWLGGNILVLLQVVPEAQGLCEALNLLQGPQ
jgi:hypothetical protein